MLNVAKKLLGIKNNLKKSFMMTYEGHVIDSSDVKKTFGIEKFSPNVKDVVLFLNKLNVELSSLSKVIAKQPVVNSIELAEIKAKHKVVFDFLTTDENCLLFDENKDGNFEFIKDFKLTTTTIEDNKGNKHKIPAMDKLNPFNLGKIAKETKVQ